MKKIFLILLISINTNSQNKWIINTPCIENYNYILKEFNKDSALFKTRNRIDFIKKSKIKHLDSYPFNEILFESNCEYYPNFLEYKSSNYLLNFTYGTLLLYPNKKLHIETNCSNIEFKTNPLISYNRALRIKNLFIDLGIDGNRIIIIDYKSTRPLGKDSKKTQYQNRYIRIIYPSPE